MPPVRTAGIIVVAPWVSAKSMGGGLIWSTAAAAHTCEPILRFPGSTAFLPPPGRCDSALCGWGQLLCASGAAFGCAAGILLLEKGIVGPCSEKGEVSYPRLRGRDASSGQRFANLSIWRGPGVPLQARLKSSDSRESSFFSCKYG